MAISSPIAEIDIGRLVSLLEDAPTCLRTPASCSTRVQAPHLEHASLEPGSWALRAVGWITIQSPPSGYNSLGVALDISLSTSLGRPLHNCSSAPSVLLYAPPSLNINLARPGTPTSRTRVSGGISSAALHYQARYSFLGRATPAPNRLPSPSPRQTFLLLHCQDPNRSRNSRTTSSSCINSAPSGARRSSRASSSGPTQPWLKPTMPSLLRRPSAPVARTARDQSPPLLSTHQPPTLLL